jgi:methylaspartate mutase epsilon subunit
MELRNRRWTEEELFEMRKEVLAQWPTGKQVDLDEAIEYHKQLPPNKVAPHVQGEAAQEGKSLLIPQIGRATFEETRDFIKYVEAQTGSLGGWLVYSDPYTRKNRFGEAQKGIERSVKEGISMMSGYPLVNYGVKYARQLVENSISPLRQNSADEDPRLQQEIGLAGGFTSHASVSLQDLIAHCKDYPLAQRIINAQYGDRLAAYYTERGAPVLAVCATNLTGWDMPAFKVVVDVLQAMLAATQGCKHIELSIGLGQNLVQDVAASRTLRKLGREYTSRLGYKDISFNTGGFPYLGDWPRDLDRATAMICWNTIIGILGEVNSIRLKCIDEAHATPTKEGMARAAVVAYQLIRIMGTQRLPESPELKLEQEMTEKEVRATVDKVMELGDGDVAIGMVKAVEHGILDTIFSPWRHLKGNILLVRDYNSAIRYLDYGNLPLPAEVAKYHKEKIAQREKAEGVKADLEMIIKEITYCSTPLFK